MKLKALLKNKKTVVAVVVVAAIVIGATSLSSGEFLSGSIRRVSPINQGPKVSCSYTPANPKVGEMVTFTASATGFYDNNVVDFQWAGAVSGYAKTFKKQFNAPGTYTANVTGTYDESDLAPEIASANCTVKVSGTAFQNTNMQQLIKTKNDPQKYNQ